MPMFPMTRCHSCDSTIKRADEFHYTTTTFSNMPHRWDAYLYNVYPRDFWCCECLGHNRGSCNEQIAKDHYNMAFKQALVRSMGGVTRQGFLESDEPMRRYYGEETKMF